MTAIKMTWPEVAFDGEKSVTCSGGCGRILRRRKKFYQTLNPWNKMANGCVKSRKDISAELAEARDEWKKEPEICKHCKQQGV